MNYFESKYFDSEPMMFRDAVYATLWEIIVFSLKACAVILILMSVAVTYSDQFLKHLPTWCAVL